MVVTLGCPEGGVVLVEHRIPEKMFSISFWGVFAKEVIRKRIGEIGLKNKYEFSTLANQEAGHGDFRRPT